MKNQRSVSAAALAAAALALAVGGCSFSYSSESISGSIEGSSKSSSSSSPGDKETAYRDDVRDYTSAYVRSSADAHAFFRGLGQLAERHGVTGWEADRATWVGIGEGLAKAEVSGAQLDAFKHSLTGDDPARMATIQEGFEAYAAS
jgi:hypothetical protein